MNFYIAGMAANQAYVLVYQINTGGTITQNPQILSFTPGSIPTGLSFPAMGVTVPPQPGADTNSRIVLSGFATPPYFPTATDLSANIIWYYSLTPPTQLTRPVVGGTMLLIASGSNSPRELLVD